METQLDLAGRLLELTRDPDLWTRLQALRSLRQWFYRTGDVSFQRRIIDTYLERMAEPDVAVVRKNLSEGLYIMLDENLGGSISLQKNIAELPEKLRPGIIEARRAVERDVLLNPVLAALERGNLLQRSAVLEAFDGSFLKGRSYARQPENMIDVGNDREFGFLYEPPLALLERTFTVLFTASLPTEPRRQSIQLCSFFKVPERTSNAAIQARLIAALLDSNTTVRAAARAVVGSELSLTGTEDDAGRISALNNVLTGSGSVDARAALLAAIARNGRLCENSSIKAAIRSLLPREDAAADLLPILGRPEFTLADRLSVIDRGWKRISPPQRITALELLFAQPALEDRAMPSDQILELLWRAATDPSDSVRERALSGISGLPAFWSSRKASQFLLIALADDAPAIRKLGLALAASKSSFWERPDAREHLARLLVDPDASVRSDALDVVKHHRLVAKFSALAKRVKALGEDPSLAARADAVLLAAGFDPARVQSDISLSRPRTLSLATFRRTVNPLFYEAGEDTFACARCHANHTILRIAAADPAKGYTDLQLLSNYNSVLNLVNLGEPESSLILRKPLSPEVQGVTDPASPSGLTHVGGPRWESSEHPAYRAILAWIREASAPPSGSEVSADAPRVKRNGRE